jgi:pilus assembly protein CpaB
MRRIIGIAASVALLAAGTLLLVGYVRGAEERALAGEEIIGVLVVDQQIEAGTAAADIGDTVRIEKVPLKVRVEGAITDLAQVEGLVASADLLPGEQLTAARFAEPEALMEHRAVEAPAGTVRVTVSLSPERAVGGQLIPGDTVAVIASFDPFDIVSVEPGEVIAGGEEGETVYVGSTAEDQPGLRTPNSSHLILHGVVVTNVQVEQLPTAPGEDAEGADVPDLAPTGNLLVTLAVLPAEAEKVVFTAEHGFVWLVGDDEGTSDQGTSIQTRETVYR